MPCCVGAMTLTKARLGFYTALAFLAGVGAGMWINYWAMT